MVSKYIRKGKGERMTKTWFKKQKKEGEGGGLPADIYYKAKVNKTVGFLKRVNGPIQQKIQLRNKLMIIRKLVTLQ